MRCIPFDYLEDYILSHEGKRITVDDIRRMPFIIVEDSSTLSTIVRAAKDPSLPKILPCPFCGSEANVKVSFNRIIGAGYVSVKCTYETECGVETQHKIMSMGSKYGEVFKVTKELIDHWNWREIKSDDHGSGL